MEPEENILQVGKQPDTQQKGRRLYWGIGLVVILVIILITLSIVISNGKISFFSQKQLAAVSAAGLFVCQDPDGNIIYHDVNNYFYLDKKGLTVVCALKNTSGVTIKVLPDIETSFMNVNLDSPTKDQVYGEIKRAIVSQKFQCRLAISSDLANYSELLTSCQ